MNGNNDAAERVKAIVARVLGVDRAMISDTSSLADDLNADSLEVTQVVMEIEEEFEIEFLDDADDTIQTIDDLVSFVSQASKSASH